MTSLGSWNKGVADAPGIPLSAAIAVMKSSDYVCSQVVQLQIMSARFGNWANGESLHLPHNERLWVAQRRV